MQGTARSETPPTRDSTRRGSMRLFETVPCGCWLKDTKSWHVGTTQRCNKLTSATSRTGLYHSGVFTTLEVSNSGVFTTLGFYAGTRF